MGKGKKRKAAALAPAASGPAAQAAAPAPRRPAHEHTGAAPTGLGQQVASAQGRLASGPLQELCTVFPAAKWAPPAVARSACCASPAAAVELELARAAALEQLRSKYASLCAKAGLRNAPLLSFERWRFAAKWAEEEPQRSAPAGKAGTAGGGGGSTQQAKAAAAAGPPGSGSGGGKRGKAASSNTADPVLPYGSLPPAAEPGLVADLLRSGLAEAAATGVAQQLAQASQEACARLAKRRHQLASGAPPSCPKLQLAFHRHSMDLTCGSRFVKLSPAFYGKLARMYRAHWLEAPGAAAGAADCSIGLAPEAAAARLAGMDAAGQQGSGAGANAISSLKPSGDASDDDSPDGEPATGAAAAGSATLCAEARIAQLEAAPEGEGSGNGDSSGGGGGIGGEGGGPRSEFHLRLFALLLRYKSIQGAGFQAAAGPPVFRLLRDRLAVGCECFASPLNASFARFGSAFPDVDGPFGSAGSFFSFQLKHGSYEVNPPFVPALLTAAAQRVLALLQAAEAAGGALSFAFIMPGWQEVAGWQLLQSSPFLRECLLVAAADHGFCDGSSHQARDPYRQSPFDTGLFILQTSAGAKKWGVTPPLVAQLRTAMAACVPSAAAAERQRKQRGQNDLEWQGLIKN